MGQGSVIRFENVGVRYGMGPEVLHDINFDLEPGSFHFLTGPSGAGKSSLLKLMYLANRPSRGLISMFGQDVTKAEREDLPALRRRIGVVFQDFRLLHHLTALDNVALPLRIAGAREDRSAIMSPSFSPGSGSPSGSMRGRRPCPAASSSGSPSPAR